MDESIGYLVMHVVQVVCALLVLGLAGWLAVAIIGQDRQTRRERLPRTPAHDSLEP